MSHRLSLQAFVLATVLFVAYAAGTGLAGAHGQQAIALDLLDESRFWIEGTTSVNTFTCRVGTVHGEGHLPAGVPPVSASEDTRQPPSVTVPVDAFDCGNPRMSDDLKETLQAAEHPTIHFRLHDVQDIVPPDTASNWYRLHVLGFLTISGTERLVRVSAWGRPVADSVYRVRGCKAVKMTYFGIEPPTKFMNLVKVHNQIEVHFDILARAASPSPVASFSSPLQTPPDCHDE